MKIDITWDDEDKTIIRYTFIPGWTLEEFYQVFDRASDMIRQSPHRVIGIIVDDSHATTPPPNVLGAYRRVASKGKLPLAVVGGGHLSMLLMKIAEEVGANQRQIFYTKTIEEARGALKDFAGANTEE
jgi:hypothetical protein